MVLRFLRQERIDGELCDDDGEDEEDDHDEPVTSGEPRAMQESADGNCEAAAKAVPNGVDVAMARSLENESMADKVARIRARLLEKKVGRPFRMFAHLSFGLNKKCTPYC